jgi:hypothetical protein
LELKINIETPSGDLCYFLFEILLKGQKEMLG